MTNEQVQAAARVLRQWWSFNDRQQHTHSWHDRENFIEKELPKLIAALDPATVERCAQVADAVAEKSREQIERNNEYAKRSRTDAHSCNRVCSSHISTAIGIAYGIRALASRETK